MIVKTTVRWRDCEGNILGAVRENDMELPHWGKKRFMRNEIIDFIRTIADEASDRVRKRQRKSFSDYALNSFRVGGIVQIKSKAKNSFINLMDSELSEFINNRVVEYIDDKML